LPGRDLFELLNGQAALIDGRSIRGWIVRVGPSPTAAEGVRARAEAKIGFAAPIFQIVARTKAGQRPIGNFVMVVASFTEAFAGEFVGFGHGVVAGNG